MRRLRLAASALAAALLLAACTGADAEAGQSAEALPPSSADLDCGENEAIVRTLPGGMAWSMCWAVEPKSGLVLRDIRFTPTDAAPILVIGEMTIAQLEVPYDSGERTTYDLSEAGFGGTRMQTLSGVECTGDRIAAEIPDIGEGEYGQTREREVLCSEEVDTGIAYRSGEAGRVIADRRSEWRLSSISKVGWYEYVVQYAFGSDGTIGVDLGATGDISPIDFSDHHHGSAVGEGDADYATSHSHNAVWRIHWALDAPGRLAVEQYDAEPTGEFGEQSPIVEGSLVRLETPAIAQWHDRRWWRVLAPGVLNEDGRPISYEIDVGKSDTFSFTRDLHAHGPESAYDVAFTNADECALLATANRGRCGDGVLDYVERTAHDPLEDVVSWVASGYHHVVRDEDQSPMDMHWQGFLLRPRDLTAQRVAIPEERAGINGIPEAEWAERYRDEVDR